MATMPTFIIVTHPNHQAFPQVVHSKLALQVRMAQAISLLLAKLAPQLAVPALVRKPIISPCTAPSMALLLLLLRLQIPALVALLLALVEEQPL